MADGRIRVSVLEGSFTGLQVVGIPLPVCIHLEDLELQLEGAQWTAKQSNTGFSISFFWPFQDCSTVGANLPCKKRRRSCLDGPVAAWGEYKASTMWIIGEKLVPQLMPTVLPPMASYLQWQSFHTFSRSRCSDLESVQGHYRQQ